MAPDARPAVATLLALALAGSVARPARLAAQSGALVAQVGAAYDLPPSSSSADPYPYAHGGLTLEAWFPSAWVLAGVNGGLGLDDQGLNWGSAWAAAGGDLPLSGSVTLELAGLGRLFAEGSESDYRGATLRGGPALRLESGPVYLRIGLEGGVGTVRATVVDSFVRTTRRGMRLYQVGTRLSADLWSWGGRAELELGSGPVRPRVTGEAWDAPQGGYAGGTAGIAFLAGRWDGELGVGAWSTPDGDEITAVLRVRVLLPSGAEATLDAARYAPDPLLDTRVAGGGGASLAVPLARFGTGAEAAGAPVPNARDAARTVEGPAVRFFLPDPEATSASLVGDFSEWREIPMARVDGGWAVELDLGPGLYAYGFLVDGRWEVPEDLSGGRTDEWGRPEARVLVVAPDAATEDGP